MKADEVLAGLRRHYGTLRDDPMGHEWSLLPEFALRPGGGQQRIDVLAVRNWRGRPAGHERHALEVKVSRSDLLGELARPDKRAPFVEVTHRFYFATPPGLMRAGELPDGCGLLEVHPHGVKVVTVAPRRVPEPLPPGALIEAMRRASRAEHRLAVGTDDVAELARLRIEVDRLYGRVSRAQQARQREEERARIAIGLVVDAADRIPCKCGDADLTPATRRNRWEFSHRDGSACRYTHPWPDNEGLAGMLGIPSRIPEGDDEP